MTCYHCGKEIPGQPPVVIEADVFCREACAESDADFRARERAQDAEFEREYR